MSLDGGFSLTLEVDRLTVAFLAGSVVVAINVGRRYESMIVSARARSVSSMMKESSLA